MTPRNEPAAGVHVYGPVPSRRLGFSLGVDILPRKTCTLDCIYCQLGRTHRTTARRGRYYPPGRIVAQVKKAVESGKRIDHITFSGSGEPTLNADLGKIIRDIKIMTDIPIAVLTNGTLLSRADVRRDLLAADLVVPSLDAVTPGLFARVNRPGPGLDVEAMVGGLEKFRRDFKGKIWLEIMLVKGINDSPAHLRKLRTAAGRIKPDRIHLNTVVRPPAEKEARPLSFTEMEKIRAFFGPAAEIAAHLAPEKQTEIPEEAEAAIIAMAGRRPVTAEDIAVSLGKQADEVLKILGRLLDRKEISSVRHKNRVYYKRPLKRPPSS